MIDEKSGFHSKPLYELYRLFATVDLKYREKRVGPDRDIVEQIARMSFVNKGEQV